MREIEPKIKPLYRDLQELNIGSYLKSSDFDRQCLKHGLEDLWQKSIEAYEKEGRAIILGFDMTSNDRENAFRILLNWSFRSNPMDFNSIVYIILSGFIDSFNKIQNLDKVFEDLELIGYPDNKLQELRKLHNENQSKIQVIKQTKKITEEKETKKKPDIFIESKKTAWIDLIAKADIQSTLNDIKVYATENKLDNLIKQIVNLSSRWYRINQSDNHGIINIDDKNREINKINDALIDLIMEIK